MFDWFFGMPGSGKTTLGKLFAAMTGRPCFDGDDFHTDEDRLAVFAGNFTLARRHAQLRRICLELRLETSAVVTHPLPDRESRDRIRGTGARLVYVHTPLELIRQWLENEDRKDHHFRPEMLDPWREKHWQEPTDEPHFVIENSMDRARVIAQLEALRAAA